MKWEEKQIGREEKKKVGKRLEGREAAEETKHLMFTRFKFRACLLYNNRDLAQKVAVHIQIAVIMVINHRQIRLP